MQPVLSSKSELLDSLKVYLNNKNRLQPIIGLGSIIECVKVGARCREAWYLCEVCVCRLSRADMRNHIMGSLHRYNYIKAWQPQLVCEWEENPELSRLAWPLMEIAKKIEGSEGSGDVQLIEVEDGLYQEMATLSENDAVTLIKTVRDWQGEPESHSQSPSVKLEQRSVQSQRVVLLGPKRLCRSDDVISHTTSSQTNRPHPACPTAAPAVKSEGWFTNLAASHSNDSEPSVFSESSSSSSSSFLDGYTGTKPLIGLCRVVECRSDTGCTFVFLCHCCRVRSNKKDVIDHLTGSSHLINYLMETCPEQVEAAPADIDDNFLQSLARHVERVEGRGELKVINAPEALCIPLTGKSYHWCMRMLSNRWDTSTPKKIVTVRGRSVNKTSVEVVTEKHSAALSKLAKRTTAKRKKGKVADTLFTVSLPLTKGPVVLQRTSFSKDSLPVSHSPPLASDIFPSPESNSDDGDLVCDAGPLAVDQAEHDLYSEAAEADQYMAGEQNYKVTERVSQFRDAAEREDHEGYGERNHGTHHGFQERSRGNYDEEMATQYRHTEMLSPALPHTYISCPPEMGYVDHWYYQQLRHNPHMAPDHTSFMTATVGHSGEVAPPPAPRVNAWPQLGDVLARSGSVAPETSACSLGAEQRQVPTYMEYTAGNVQLTPQSYGRDSLAYHCVQTGHRAMCGPSYGDGWTRKPDGYFTYPDGGGGGGNMSWSNAFIPPQPPLYYGTHSDFNFRDTGLLRADDFQGWR